MARGRRGRPWCRGPAGWLLAAGLVAAAAAAVLLWPRGPVYADYVDGRRPTLVFVWSDPTPHHPYG